MYQYRADRALRGTDEPGAKAERGVTGHASGEAQPVQLIYRCPCVLD
jgi:hypothetical protein